MKSNPGNHCEVRCETGGRVTYLDNLRRRKPGDLEYARKLCRAIEAHAAGLGIEIYVHLGA